MKITRFIIALLLAAGIMRVAVATQDFDAFVAARSAGSFPLGSGDLIPVVQGGVTKYVAGNAFDTLTGSQTLTNKTISGSSNTLTVLAASQLSGLVPIANGGTNLATYTSGGIPCATASNILASSGALTANKPMIGGGAGVCPSVGTTTGPGTLFVVGTGSYTTNHGLRVNASGQIVDSTAAAFIDTANSWTAATQTFGTTLGTQNPQAGTTYLFAQTDCGKPIYMTSASTVTVTLPSTITVPCTAEVGQGGNGQVVFMLGSGATGNVGNTGPANPHGFTKTFGKDARVGLQVDINPGGTAAHWVLTGDGA